MPQEKKHQYTDDQMKGIILALIGAIVPALKYERAEQVADIFMANLNDENGVLATLLKSYDDGTYTPTSETRQ